MAKRKRNNPATDANGSGEKRMSHTTITFTSHRPEWAYIHLELVTQPSEPSTEFLDLLTARTYLTSALSQFLGLSGTAIPIDILKLQTEELPTVTASAKRKIRNMLWIRVPHDDAAAVIAAVSSWVGGGGVAVAWKIRGKGSWLGALVGGTGRELFL
ncbi:ribonuclease P [Emydomyces testavorans]|uniref:Ribonuclease P n=1 Tax=Emydomyces testavorans TaxID=2070801 RepID=A0AAF0DDS5_9EURO|nr:ribonuclease P [Emydomyces testavorans]